MPRRQIPLPYPFHVFQHSGLLDSLDAQDKLRGLFSYFDNDSEQRDSPTADGPVNARPSVVDDPPQDSTLDYARRQAQLALWGMATLGTGGLTQDPLTGEIHYTRNAIRLGNRMSEIAQQVPFGPGRAGGPSRPTGPAAVRTQPQAGSGFLFGRPQANASENQVYAVRSARDPGDGCDDDYEEDMQHCDKNFSYDKGAYARCAGRNGIRLGQCSTGVPRRQRIPLWSDEDEDGVNLSRR